MKNKNGESSRTDFVIKLAVGTAAALITCIIFLTLFAFILSKTQPSDSSILGFSLAAQAISAFVGSFVAAKLNKKNGLGMGAALGAVLFLIFTAISLILHGNITLLSLIRAGIMLACAALGGIVGVNIKKQEKII